DRNDSGLAWIGECGQRSLLDRTLSGRHEDEVLVIEGLHRQHGGDFLAFHQREEIDDRATTRVTCAFRHFIDLEPVHPATVGEAQDVVMSIGDEQAIDEIVVLHAGSLLATATAALGTVIAQRLTFDVDRKSTRLNSSHVKISYAV